MSKHRLFAWRAKGRVYSTWLPAHETTLIYAVAWCLRNGYTPL